LNTRKEHIITSTLAAYGSYNIADNWIVWEDDRNNKATDIIRGGSNLSENNKDIFAYNLKNKKEIPIATGPFMESSPDVSHDKIVWEDRNNGTLNADIVLYNLTTKEKRQTTKDEYNQADPKIYGENIVWMDERRGTSSNDVYINGQPPNSDIILYNLNTILKSCSHR
jgi:beta propeller repeat protein